MSGADGLRKDYLFGCSYGEGFGIPILETQSRTACCPRETVPDSCSCPDGCECRRLDCACGDDSFSSRDAQGGAR